MNADIVGALRCPVSGAPLEIITIAAEPLGAHTLVRTGILFCPASKLWYPVINHVPVLLVFATALARRFAADHEAVIAGLQGYAAPHQAPMPGEVAVQRTFTEEWGGLGADERTFIYSDAELVALHRDVWLRMSEAERAAVATVADIGCGFGKEALVLAEIFPRAAIFAMDLNLALLRAGPSLDRAGRVHPVIASLFRLPLAPGSMSHVHCQGVLHHTYSTEAAFKSIAALVGAGGSLFVWVYAKEDALVVPGLRGWLIWAYWLVSHRIGRPILSRLPAPLRNLAMLVLAGIAHPLMKLRDKRGGQWRFRNTLHGLRDAFTPRHAHQHGFNEVVGWFEDASFEPRLQSPRRYRELVGRRLLGIGVMGRRSPAEAAPSRPVPLETSQCAE
jgi:SAM-dependent methyltransferase/uncharacterized protein YbaR (Trm112 family)